MAERRKIVDMVQEAIAAAAGGSENLAEEVGVSYGTLWAWASGRRNPSVRNLRRLAAVLRRRGGKLQEIASQLERAAGE